MWLSWILFYGACYMLICISILQRISLQKKTAQKHFDWNNDDFRKLLGFVNMKHAKRKLPNVLHTYVRTYRSVIKMRMLIKKFSRNCHFHFFSPSELRVLKHIFINLLCGFFRVVLWPNSYDVCGRPAVHWLYSFFFWSYRFVSFSISYVSLLIILFYS